MTLATAYWCILIAALLPYVWATLAKAGTPGYNNRNPRAWVAKQRDNHRMQRAYNAHFNAFEAFAPFAAGVLMAQAAGVDPARIGALAVAFVVFRILHGALYIADAHLLRSLAWIAGFCCTLALIGMAALAIA